MKNKKIKALLLTFLLTPFINVNATSTNTQTDNITYETTKVNGSTNNYYVSKVSKINTNNKLEVSLYTYNGKTECNTETIITTPPFSNDFLMCSTLNKRFTYLTDNQSYPIEETYYNNGAIKTKVQYLRNSAKNITEKRVYNYTNNIITNYTKYYGGKKLSPSILSYNKTYIQTKNLSNKVTSVANYELSKLWNEQKANVRTSYTTYSYYSNGIIKNANRYYKSVSTNRKTKSILSNYRSNGTLASRYYYSYYNNYSNRPVSKTKYVYNKKGVLQSSKSLGNAYRYNATYSTSGKTNSFKVYKYNYAKKAYRIK